MTKQSKKTPKPGVLPKWRITVWEVQGLSRPKTCTASSKTYDSFCDLRSKKTKISYIQMIFQQQSSHLSSSSLQPQMCGIANLLFQNSKALICTSFCLLLILNLQKSLWKDLYFSFGSMFFSAGFITQLAAVGTPTPVPLPRPAPGALPHTCCQVGKAQEGTHRLLISGSLGMMEKSNVILKEQQFLWSSYWHKIY